MATVDPPTWRPDPEPISLLLVSFGFGLFAKPSSSAFSLKFCELPDTLPKRCLSAEVYQSCCRWLLSKKKCILTLRGSKLLPEACRGAESRLGLGACPQAASLSFDPRREKRAGDERRARVLGSLLMLPQNLLCPWLVLLPAPNSISFL